MRNLTLLLLLITSTIYGQECDVLNPVNTSGSIVLGNGTANSVNAADIQSALDSGGAITFDLGPNPSVIDLTTTLFVTRDVVIDGGDLVTLNGMNQHRIFQIENPNNNDYTFTLQNIQLINGNSGASGDLSNSGGAIFKPSGGPWQAVNLQVVNVTFDNNHAVQVHQDGGGGAIYVVGMNDVFISGSHFFQNSGSNGGAFYSLGSKNIKITDSQFDNNHATGNNGNPGNGGNAGAIGVDGAERSISICRSQIINNTANAFGTGFFSVMYDQDSLSAFVDTTFENNINAGDLGLGGGAYLQGGPFIIQRSSFIANQAPGAGGLFFGPNANGTFINSTIYGNIATQSLAGGMAIDSSAILDMNHLTIVGNEALCPVCFAAGISLSQNNSVTMSNTILANNVGGNEFNPWNIRFSVSDGGGNIQFPELRPNGQAEPPATASVIWADPLLSDPTDNGSYTPTMALNANSPAIDVANNDNTTASDQRGVSRYMGSDIGAYEVAGPDIIFKSGFE